MTTLEYDEFWWENTWYMCIPSAMILAALLFACFFVVGTIFVSRYCLDDLDAFWQFSLRLATWMELIAVVIGNLCALYEYYED